MPVGAKELAELGYSYNSILQYYYPGTELHNAARSQLLMPVIPTPNAAQRVRLPIRPGARGRPSSAPRDQARLLVMEQSGGAGPIAAWGSAFLLRPGDLVVVNNTKVMPARVPAQVRSDGKCLDLLFVRDLGRNCGRC